MSGLNETRRDANAAQAPGELTSGGNKRMENTYQRCLEDRETSLLILRLALAVVEPGTPLEGRSWMGFRGQREADLLARRSIDH